MSRRTTSGLQEKAEDSERAAPRRAPRSPATGPHLPGPGKQALTSGPLSCRGPASTEQPKLATSHVGNQDAVLGDNRLQGYPLPCKHPTGSKLARQPGGGPPLNRLPAQHGGWEGQPRSSRRKRWAPAKGILSARGLPGPGVGGPGRRAVPTAPWVRGAAERRTHVPRNSSRAGSTPEPSHQMDPALTPAHGPRPTASSQDAPS